MGLTLRVDGDRWRAHLKDMHERHPRLVPVAKGNGYGFGLGRLARKSQWLGVDTLAVGTYEEIPEVEQRYDGSLLVLTPWRPFNPAPDNPRVIHTAGRLEDLTALAEHGTASGERPAGDPGADDLDAPPRVQRTRPARGDEAAEAPRRRPGGGSGAAPAARPEVPGDLPPQRGGTADERRGLRRGGPARPPGLPHGLGLPPHRDRAHPARAEVPRLRLPPPRRHRPVAR